KCNHTTPAKAGELCSQLCWSEPQGPEIVMSARLNAFYPASHIPWMCLVEQIIDAGTGMARASEYRVRLLLLIWLQDFLNLKEGHSRERALSSLIRSGCAISSASSPPCGGIR